MGHYTDSLYDWLLIAVVLLSIFNAIYLLKMFLEWRQEWSAKTRDYWFVMFGWSIFGAYGSAEALYRDIEGGPRFILLFAVTAATFSGLFRKGPWGSDSA